MARCTVFSDISLYFPCIIKDDFTNFSKKEIRTAIRNNDKKTIDRLIKGVNAADIRDHEGSTLLHMAINVANSEIIQFLINKGCFINAQDRNGATPLLNAMKFSCWPTVSKLLNANANLFLADNKGINALKLVLRINEKKNRMCLINIISKHLQVCGLNSKALASLLLGARWPLHYAIDIRNSELIKLMLEAGCSINSQDKFTNEMTALHKAIRNGDTESTKILLQYGADIDIHHGAQRSPFQQATTITYDMNTEIFEIFLERELQRFNTDGMIYSFKNFSCVHNDVIKLLAKYKVKLTTKDSFGSILLHNLIFNNNRQVNYLILGAKFDVDIKDTEGNTALHYAVMGKYCLEALINKGADVNARNKNGHTPLIKAINHFLPDWAIELLIENGAILDEEMQNYVLNYITKTNIEYSRIRPLIKRIAIIHLQSEAISERNKRLIENYSRIHYLYELCLQDLHLMKQTQVTANGHISVFDILCISEHQLLNYSRNEEIVQNFFAIQVCERYQIYGKYLLIRFESACFKQNCIQNAIDFLSNNIKQLNGNSAIINNIVRFFSRDDWIIFHTN